MVRLILKLTGFLGLLNFLLLYDAQAAGGEKLADSQSSMFADQHSERLLFVDPETGKHRAPTPREAAALHRNNRFQVADEPLRVIRKADGSTMMYLPQRFLLQLEAGTDGAVHTRHRPAQQTGAK